MIKPLGSRVLLKPSVKVEEMVGGIYIPDKAKEKPMESEVVALGIGNKENFTVKVGDTVITSKHGGSDIKADGIVYRILEEKEILAIIE